MNAERFHGEADGPDLVVDRASDGTPLPECRGWVCGCGRIFVTRDDAEFCCVGPDAVVGGCHREKAPPASGRHGRPRT